MKPKIITIISAAALITSPVSAKDTKSEATKAAAATAAGASAGAALAAATGPIGVALIAPTITILSPAVVAGAVVGLAGYGFYSIFK